MSELMHIGQMAQQAGTTTRTVRFYEEMGLIEPEARSPGGFRCYSDRQLTRLQMILSLKRFEFDLEHIKRIMDKREICPTGGGLASAILEDLRSRLGEVDTQINHLSALRDDLRRSVDSLCHCEPCELRLTDRLCAQCKTVHDDDHEALPFFHALPMS
jgi:DNA-binding transcriptional MerR regulator